MTRNSPAAGPAGPSTDVTRSEAEAALVAVAVRKAAERLPLVTAQYFWRKTSAWLSVTPAAVVTTFRLSPQVTKRRDPFDAIWL
jgi:hypothetical protein